MAAPFAISLILLFNVPSEFSEGAKNVYVFLTYCFMAVICYTAVNLGYHAMLPRFSLTSQDRSSVSVIRQIVVLIAVLLMTSLTPTLLALFGGEHDQRAWSVVSAIYAVLALVFVLLTFFGVKEKLPVTVAGSDGIVQKPRLKQSVIMLLSNRYFYISVFLFVAYSLSNGGGGAVIYYARDVLGNANMFALFSIASVVPMVVGMPFVPALFLKFGKRKSMMAGLVAAILAAAAALINPYSVPLVLASLIIRGFGLVPLSGGIFTLAGDIVDFNELKTGIRAEGIATSANSFGSKIGTGLGSALLGWMLAFGKYDGSLTVQPPSAIGAMIMLMHVVPIIIYSVSFVLLAFWNMDQYAAEISAMMKRKEEQEDHLK
jgi:GPH family glycoside/pentoside/hexuronide:cation symporter